MVGGVIAYRSASTKLWRGLSGLIEGGTDGILNAEARYAVGDIDWGLSLTGNVVSTDGQPNARGGARPIGRDSYTISVKGDWEVTDHIDLRAVGRYVLTEGDFNDSDFDPASPTFGLIIDSPGTRFENEALYGLVGIRFEPAGTGWTHDLSAQFADIARDTFNAFGRSSGSEGDRLKASYVTSYEFGWRERQTITGALDWEREGFRNTDPFGIGSTTRQEIQNVGIVADYRLMGQKVDLAAAVRHDINDRFADETTFKLSAAARINQDVRLRGSIGSGTKNPGFFELFGFFDGRFIGNEDLQPEKSTEWEVGLDWELDGRDTLVSLVYFESELENEIFTTFPAPDFVATPANRDTVSRRKGVELSMNAEIGRQLSVDAAYSYLDAEEDGVTEVRRPDHIASAALNWTAPGDTASATLVVRHNGAAEDLAFTDPSFIPVRVALDDYTLVNLNARVRLAQGIEAFGRVENLLDETYEQVFSFVSPGRSAVVGLQASF